MIIKKIFLYTGLFTIGLFLIGIYCVEQDLFNKKIENFNNRASGDAVLVAKDTVKEHCAPDIWNNWEVIPEEKDKTEFIGLARPLQISRTNNEQNSYYKIDLHIDPKLVNTKLIEDVAWHECAHAKTYIVEESAEHTELKKEINENFKNGEHSYREYLADAMTQVKQGKTHTHTPYQTYFTAEQLRIAQKVWDNVDIVSHKTPFIHNY